MMKAVGRVHWYYYIFAAAPLKLAHTHHHHQSARNCQRNKRRSAQHRTSMATR
jgi:hypothetical protein